jgi:hypothetical protein
VVERVIVLCGECNLCGLDSRQFLGRSGEEMGDVVGFWKNRKRAALKLSTMDLKRTSSNKT